MRLRTYTVTQKYIKNKHGEIGFYKKKIKKWIKSSQPYKPQKRGLNKLSIHSTRFGFLDLYNRKEQQELICPSGYSISQCFNVLRKLWYAYRRAIGADKDIDKMKKYAKAIQDVQKDMGIKTASFPHLGIFGDALILNSENGIIKPFESSSPKKKPKENEIHQVENAIKIHQVENAIKIQGSLLNPNTLGGKSIVTLSDNVSPYQKQDCKITVPMLLEANGENEKIQCLVDNVPFRRRRRLRVKSNDESTNEVSPYQKQDCKIIVPMLLEANGENEEIQSLVDNVPFRRRRRLRVKRNGMDESTLPLVNGDDESPQETINAETEDRVPLILEPEENEELLVISDDIHFRFL